MVGTHTKGLGGMGEAKALKLVTFENSLTSLVILEHQLREVANLPKRINKGPATVFAM
jgi:hypothetical protein